MNAIEVCTIPIPDWLRELHEQAEHEWQEHLATLDPDLRTLVEEIDAEVNHRMTRALIYGH